MNGKQPGLSDCKNSVLQNNIIYAAEIRLHSFYASSGVRAVFLSVYIFPGNLCKVAVGKINVLRMAVIPSPYGWHMNGKTVNAVKIYVSYTGAAVAIAYSDKYRIIINPVHKNIGKAKVFNHCILISLVAPASDLGSIGKVH